MLFMFISTVTDCALDDRGSIPGKGRFFSVLQPVHTSCETNLSYSIPNSAAISLAEGGVGLQLVAHRHIVKKGRAELYLHCPCVFMT